MKNIQNINICYGSGEPVPVTLYSSIEDWLYAECTSSFIITDSFHGTVFAILFNRPFYVIGNKKRGNGRILDLLSTFGLEDRMVDICSQHTNKETTINWDAVNTILVEQRQLSISFIKSSLE